MLMVRLFHFLFLLIGLCACSLALSGESTMNNPMLSKMRPWCIGRLVFDRPVSSEISDEKFSYRGDRFVTTHDVSSDVYRKIVGARENQLRTKQRVNPVNLDEKTGKAWLEKAFSPVRDSRVFIYQEGVAKVKLPFKSEGYFFAGRTLFHTTGGIGEDGLYDAENIYNDIYRRIKARDNWAVPTESGFCIDGGIVTGSSTYTEEVSQSFALMPVAARTGIIRGDGTVPVWSADAQARGLKPDVPGDPVEGVQMAFVQGGYQHMNSYAHSWTHWALLYSVVQIVNDI
jgi:Tle cognate immunity protein 4 N-terminal domain